VANQHVDILAIGAGPANLALAVALEECAPQWLARDTLLLEQYADVKWQRNLLLPWARSQVSFIKDLATLRNPQSRFSFLNFIHSQGRLDEFVNMATFYPYRSEISDYLQWVASSLERVRVRCGASCESVRVDRGADGSVHGWTVTLAGGDQVSCRDLVVGVGRDPHVPEPFRGLPEGKVIHSSRYREGLAGLRQDRAHRVVVIGAAQSAAEMFVAVHEDLPDSRPTIVMRSAGFQNYQTSKFLNELFYPSFVDEFYNATPEARQQILQEMRVTNYAGLAPPFLDELYAMIYRQRLADQKRSSVLTLTEVSAARMDGDEVVLDLRDRRNGVMSELRGDVVLLGTGYRRDFPALVRRLQPQLGLPEISVGRDYQVRLPDGACGALYLQGVNEDTHGIADSLISVLAHRSQEIVAHMVRRRTAPAAALAASAPARAVA
jgi:L-ornithine N5-monooxygenase